MKIKLETEPFDHIIVDDFLSNHTARACLEEAIRLEPFYQRADTIGTGHIPDNCEECKKLKKSERQFMRENDVIYLDDKYNNARDKSVILTSIEKKLFDEYFLAAMDDMPGVIPLLRNVTHTESILSRYGKCDFYGWHKDTLPAHPNGRVLTAVYYFNTEPQKFTGGEFLMARTIQDYKTIEPKHNRLILFHSMKLHSVDNVYLNSTEFSDGRFSLNYWLGFDGAVKIR